MARRKRWVVRVVIFGQPQAVHTLVECLRYAGIAHLHRSDRDEHASDAHGQTRLKLVFDLKAPHGWTISQTRSWAESNAKRIQTFGINAVAAPEYDFDREIPNYDEVMKEVHPS